MELIKPIFLYILFFTGSINFLFRFIYFSTKNSFKTEFNRLQSYSYFLPIEKTNIESTKTDRTIIPILNYLLKSFYISFALVLFLQMIEIIINALSEQ